MNAQEARQNSINACEYAKERFLRQILNNIEFCSVYGYTGQSFNATNTSEERIQFLKQKLEELGYKVKITQEIVPQSFLDKIFSRNPKIEKYLEVEW